MIHIYKFLMEIQIYIIFSIAELTARGDENVPQRELERITAAEQNLSLKHKLDVIFFV